MKAINFKLKSEANPHLNINGVLVDAKNSIIALESNLLTSDKRTFELNESNIINVPNFIGSFIRSITRKLDLDAVYDFVEIDSKITKIIYEEEVKPKEFQTYIKTKNMLISKYAKLDRLAAHFDIDISEFVGSELVNFPVNWEYTKNEEINKHMKDFSIELELFEKYKAKLTKFFSNNLLQLRNENDKFIALIRGEFKFIEKSVLQLNETKFKVLFERKKHKIYN